MRNLKRTITLTCAAVMAGLIVFSACKKKDTDADIGRKAAKEICACMSQKTDLQKAACLDALDDKYAKYENNQEFIKASAAELIYCDALWEWLEDYEDWE